VTSAHYSVSATSAQPLHLMPQDKEPEINYTHTQRKKFLIVRIGLIINFYSGTGYFYFKVMKDRRNSRGKSCIDQNLFNTCNG
jgi:hypothetical protein